MKKNVDITLPPKLWDKAEAYAKEKGIPLNQWIQEALYVKIAEESRMDWVKDFEREQTSV